MEQENVSSQELPAVEMSSSNQKEDNNERKLSIKDAVNSSWNLFKSNKKILLSVALIYIAVTIIESILQNNLPKKFIVQLVVNIFSIIINVTMMIGIIRILLKVSRNESASLSVIFEGKKYFLRFLGGYILYMLIVFVGYMLLIIPGLIWQFKYSYFPVLIIDKNMSPVEALKESGKITYGFKWKLFLLFFVAGLLCLVGLLLLGVGILIAYPVSLLMMVYAYRILIGERISIPSNA